MINVLSISMINMLIILFGYSSTAKHTFQYAMKSSTQVYQSHVCSGSGGTVGNLKRRIAILLV